jgi:trehalose transport system ATP-binding protein
MTKLELIDIDKSYGRKHIIDRVSLKIEEGQFFVILGPSGEGKSTLLRILAGIEKPDGGRVCIDGMDVTDLPPNKRNIAMVFQNYALYPNMNVRGNIEFPLKMRHVKSNELKRKVIEAAKALNIYDIIEKPVTKISGGQQQRVALARAMVRDPALFLLDEPLSNLDARTRFMARGELKRIQQELGQTFLYVTHDQKEAASLAITVGILHSGKFEQVGSFEEMYSTPRTKWVGQFLGEFPMNFLPGNVVGIDAGCEAGFHPEWVTVGGEDIGCTVESIETIGDVYYLFCKLADNKSVILKSQRRYEVGDKTSFKINRFNIYRESKLQTNLGGSAIG